MAIAESGGVDYSGDFYDYVLRNHFLPEVADGLNHDYILLDIMAGLKDKSMVQGKFIQHPIHEGRNMAGVGAVGVAGKLPTPGAQSYAEYQYPVRSVYGRIKFTGLAADSSSSDIDSWLRAVDSELTGLRDDLARNENRILHGTGSGIVAVVTDAAGVNGDTQTMSFFSGLEGSTTMDSGAMDTTHFVEVGERYFFYDDSDDSSDAFASNVATTVTGKTATTVTFSESINLTSGGPFFLCKANEDGIAAITQSDRAGLTSTGFAREPMGISGIVSDNNPVDTTGNTRSTTYDGDSITGFQNVDADANAFNRSQVLDNSSVKRPLTESLMQKGLSTVEKAFKGRVDCFVSSYGIRDAFADLMLTYRRHVNRMELRAGFSTVAYGDIPFIPDRDAYPNRLIGLDKGDIRQHCMGSTDYRFIDEDGSIYHRLPDEHAFQASLYRRWTFGTMCRGRHLAILDLDE